MTDIMGAKIKAVMLEANKAKRKMCSFKTTHTLYEAFKGTEPSEDITSKLILALCEYMANENRPTIEPVVLTPAETESIERGERQLSNKLVNLRLPISLMDELREYYHEKKMTEKYNVAIREYILRRINQQ